MCLHINIVIYGSVTSTSVSSPCYFSSADFILDKTMYEYYEIEEEEDF